MGVAVDVGAAAGFQKLPAGWQQALRKDFPAFIGETPSGRAVPVNEGMRMSSRMDGRPKIRTSPVCPLLLNP